MTSDQYFVLISKIREVCFELKETQKCLNMQTEAIEKNTGIQEKILSKLNEKRSLSANAYFWKLCDLIAKAIGSDKDTVYLLMLRDAGVFDYYELPVEASELIQAHYRYSEEDYRYKRLLVHPETGEELETEFVAIKCYKGSHEYDSKQMAELINQTVYVANELGIDTLTKEEIDNLVSRWQGDR